MVEKRSHGVIESMQWPRWQSKNEFVRLRAKPVATTQTTEHALRT